MMMVVLVGFGALDIFPFHFALIISLSDVCPLADWYMPKCGHKAAEYWTCRRAVRRHVISLSLHIV